MAMMDHKNFLISHLRNSFVTSDDTGMCEMIIDIEEEDERLKKKRVDSSLSDSGVDSSDNELSHSYDILPDMDYVAHRRRSNTAQRLERLKKEKRNQSKVKQISWKDTATEYNIEEKGFLFDKKDVKKMTPQKEHTKKGHSVLSQQLETSSNMGENPFLEFAKFDGRASVGVVTRKIDIFLTMAPPEERPYPMTVTVVVGNNTKVQDLVGLICWQYTNEGREPMLNENPEMYCLHIAEDDGEVDTDFPSLDSKEPVSKFGFTKLALVEKEMPTEINKQAYVVTVNIPNRGFNKFQMDSMSITMREILERVLKRRKIRVRPGLEYNLEKQSQSGVSVDLDASLACMDTMEFCLVRENSSRGDVKQDESENTSSMAESLTSHHYKSFIVSMVHRLRTNTDVQLGISGEKIEIDPVGSKGSSRLFRQRAVTYDADSIADCEVIEEKNTGKSVFRLTYSGGHEYKHHDFEADTEVCNEIVHKINNILELRLSPIRKDFVTNRERKLLRKRESLNFSS
ncbi:hypothetical protein CHS0354_013618 [Potamilus streckersoni]|uniref:Target of rapamycin complex 2 subunit MAPKAP1 n=1 Tax=Potamilus streckersoni TaxID=2493646 RepID=A0AAE0SKP1_9BIVA|nr:hypothetical protein CHS0354_013618 [Potamilus streckersoni]